jgi:hypothetical protein
MPEQHILAIAGVNRSGKSIIADLFPKTMVRGMSAAYAPDFVAWWNGCTRLERNAWMREWQVPEEFRPIFRKKIGIHTLLPVAGMTEEEESVVYQQKDAVGKGFTMLMQWARDPERGGDPHAVIRRVCHSLEGRHGVLDGLRTLTDFELLFLGQPPQTKVHVVYMDAEQRMASKIRGETEKEMTWVWRLFQSHCPDDFTVIDANGSKEQSIARVAEHAARLRAFVGLE